MIWYDIIRYYMILYDIIWYYMILYDIKWYYMILYDIIWYYMILYDIIWYYMMLYDVIWYYMILYDIIWYYMILYDIIWYYMILYDIIYIYILLYISIAWRRISACPRFCSISSPASFLRATPKTKRTRWAYRNSAVDPTLAASHGGFWRLGWWRYLESSDMIRYDPIWHGTWW